MALGYQETDRRVIDYDIWFADDARLELRGPRMAFGDERAILCVGAAQTFGRFVPDPFPAQLARLLGRPVLNLGFSGAGPEFFLRDKVLIDRIDRAPTVVVQVMSARSVTAGIFRAGDNNGVLEFVGGPRTGETMMAQAAYATLRREQGEEAFREQVGTAQAEWRARMAELLGEIPGRKILLWISEESPDNTPDLSRTPVGRFPHFVTPEMVREAAALADDFVDGSRAAETPQVLVNDQTGNSEVVFGRARFPDRPDRMRRLNVYYTPPAQHDLIAARLYRLLAGDP